jgi:hypothetical protein
MLWCNSRSKLTQTVNTIIPEMSWMSNKNGSATLKNGLLATKQSNATEYSNSTPRETLYRKTARRYNRQPETRL